MKISNFVSYCLRNNGIIKPLLVDPQLTNGTGLMNPSVYVNNEKILCNIRHVNYTLFHSEEKKFHHFWGPLQYVHPENDCTLTTVNYLCELNQTLDIIKTHKIDTSMLDVEPLWEFVGLEDVRIFNWNNKLYGSGVRRDTTTNGQGRMELSELEITDDKVEEISRWRIPAPGEDKSYCEKNWMPILDLPYHYIKWSNPTEVVQVDPIEKTCTTVYLSETFIPDLCDFRGGSQVISWNGYYLAIIHEVRLFSSELGRKDGRYYHRFVVWDKNFNIVTFSDLFDFLEGDIEFCCGLALHNDNFLVSFGFQDNSAFILSFPQSLIFNLIDVPINSNNLISNNNSVVDFEENWFTYPNLYLEMINKFSDGSRFVEVGSWKGRSSFYMCENIKKSAKDIEFFCVDTWEGSEEHIGNYNLDNLYEKFLTNMKSVESYYFPLKLDSISASKRFKDKSLDFVFIDAAHDYDSVKNDILAWLPKIKPGGVLAGHDYYPYGSDHQGVYRAVQEIFNNKLIRTSEDCFIIYL